MFILAATLLLVGVGCGFGQNVPTSQRGPAAPSVQQPSAPPPGLAAGVGTPPESGAVTVLIKNFTFQPAEITVKKGATVTWKNDDTAPHFVASDPHPTHTDLPGLSSGTFSSGGTYSFTFDKVGDFGYHCHLHPGMKGRVVVTE